jgi:hypothetical protein
MPVPLCQKMRLFEYLNIYKIHMKNIFTLLIFAFTATFSFSQTLLNGNFNSGTSSWGCSPEINTEIVYGGSDASNNVAEIDAAAGLCQTVSGFTIGSLYRLSVKASRRTGTCPGPDPGKLNVLVNGGALNGSLSRTGSFALTTTTFTFTATNTTHTLSITPAFATVTCGVIVDNISVTLVSALPIELTAFNATPDADNSVMLDWITASEKDNDYFTVERSVNGTDWDALENLKGAGNSNATLHYNTLDEAPLEGVSYYRLKQTDFNGGMSYSEIVAVERKAPAYKIYPNPIQGQFTVEGADIENAEISIYDPLGKLMQVEPVSEMQKRVYNTSGFREGVYFIRIDKAGSSETRKVTILQ